MPDIPTASHPSAASRWAREKKNLTGPLWNQAMGHGQGSNQMSTYINLKAGTVGDAFKE